MVIWCQTYGKEPLSERGNLLLPLHEYFFQLAARDLLYAPSHIPHTTFFATPVLEHWLGKKELSGSTIKDRSDDPSHHESTLNNTATSCSHI